MTLELLAKLALGGWVLYSIAAYAEGLRSRGSAGLRTINAVAEIAIVAALIWAGWWR